MGSGSACTEPTGTSRSCLDRSHRKGPPAAPPRALRRGDAAGALLLGRSGDEDAHEGVPEAQALIAGAVVVAPAVVAVVGVAVVLVPEDQVAPGAEDRILPANHIHQPVQVACGTGNGDQAVVEVVVRCRVDVPLPG